MKKILLADDEPNLRLLVRTTLEDPGYSILEAASGTKALEIVRQTRPDLLLLDWMMPGLSGIEVLERLRVDPDARHIPAIMLTAKSQEEDRARASAAGCEHFLVKPFSPLELLDKVQEVLSSVSRGAKPAERAPLADLDQQIASRLEKADDQLALYARDVKRAFEMERARSLELTKANLRLANLDRLKRDFLSFICHEMRTPLNAMAALDLYDSQGDKQEQLEVIDLARQGYERLHAFITKGLEYFGWLARDGVSPTDAVDVAELLAVALEGTPGLRAPNVRFDMRGPRPGLEVCGRMSDLQQVLRILLDNALKYSKVRHLTLETTADGESVWLRLTDTGVGIGREMLQEIFEPFTSADVAHHSLGSGLSLALARVIARAHGGDVHAESEGLGHGSTFVVRLPVASARTPKTPASRP